MENVSVVWNTVPDTIESITNPHSGVMPVLYGGLVSCCQNEDSNIFLTFVCDCI